MKDTLPFNFRMLETFVAVVECGGMTAAAKRLGWSQSAVSQTIATLEKDIACTLINRQGKGISITPSGDLFYQQSLEILTRAKKLARQLNSEDDGRLASLRIGMVDSVASTIGAGLVRRLNDHSGKIKVRSGIAPYLHEAFDKGDLDMIITMGPNSIPENGVITRVLMEAYLLAIPKDYPYPDIRLDILCHQRPLLRFTNSSSSGCWTENYLKRFNLQAENTFEFDSSTALMAMVKEGMGWTIITPLCLAQASEHLSEVRFAPLKEPGYFRELQLIYRNDMNIAQVKYILQSIEELFHSQVFPIIHRHIPWFTARDFQITHCPD
ncbi:LysR family transcriptional regulator [Parendozoicomonas haliclonae]|uniref:HTH-type transcriptional regulator GltC n=1 Tax=Parendozoicomonas haliclonae TaxID=1960125 RepID=A0A1X7AKT0_9GAMM|nr:LysR family transcriptional regulator [Parendozoicomonas haliclonae]SMA48245.1 HTH-type transcriptional regulator GltC [Parendozoicomonas haliclonae]